MDKSKDLSEMYQQPFTPLPPISESNNFAAKVVDRNTVIVKDVNNNTIKLPSFIFIQQLMQQNQSLIETVRMQNQKINELTKNVNSVNSQLSKLQQQINRIGLGDE